MNDASGVDVVDDDCDADDEIGNVTMLVLWRSYFVTLSVTLRLSSSSSSPAAAHSSSPEWLMMTELLWLIMMMVVMLAELALWMPP